MQVPILNGVFADATGDFRTAYPLNRVPVPKSTGISEGYLRPADGIVTFGAGPGVGRGGIAWNGALYRVMGTKLVRVSDSGGVTTLGEVGGSEMVAMDYGFDRLGVWSAGHLYFWTGDTFLQVTDPDMGAVHGGCYLAGYWLSTDGTSIIATDLNDPTSVNPLRYGSAESDPDEIMAVARLKSELVAFGRHSVEFFSNIGGAGFPFSRIEGAQVSRGMIGRRAFAPLGESFAFVGSARNEAPAVYMLGAGTSAKISTREIDVMLSGYGDDALSSMYVESRTEKGHQHLLIHLPDVTLCYDLAASQAAEEPVWFRLSSAVVGTSRYRARGFVRCYDRWIVEDPLSSSLGAMTSDVGSHYGSHVGWQFDTLVIYNQSKGAAIHEIELVALPGRVAFGDAPVVWTSYSEDGETWSMERPTPAGAQGNRRARIAWRRQGRIRGYRMQRFRGTSDAHVGFVRLEVQPEGLNV